jgi:hypothetical protein
LSERQVLTKLHELTEDGDIKDLTFTNMEYPSDGKIRGDASPRTTDEDTAAVN